MPLAIQAAVGKEYLHQLMTCGQNRWKSTNGKVITEHAKKCLDQMKESDSKLYWSEVKKSLVVPATLAGCLTVPVAVTGATLYASVQHWDTVKGPLKSAGELLLSASSSMVRAVEKAFQINPNLSLGIAGVTTVGSTGLFLKDITSANSVIKSLAKGLAKASVYAYFQFAVKQRDMVEKWFIEWEKEYKKDRQVAHDLIVTHMTKQFEAATESLLNQSKVEDLEQQLMVQKDIGLLKKNLPIIIADLKKLKLSKAEISAIMLPLTESLKEIEKDILSLKSGTTFSDFRYNARLIAKLDPTKATCIPAAAAENIRIAKDNQLGIGHTFKKLCSTTAAGILSFASTSAIASVAVCLSVPQLADDATLVYNACVNGLSCLSSNAPVLQHGTKAVIAGIAAGALAMSGINASSVANRWSKEAKENAAFVQERYAAAKDEINSLYNGIASYFIEEKENPRSTDGIKVLAQQLNGKMSSIIKIIDKSGIKGVTGLEATQLLREVLANIA